MRVRVLDEDMPKLVLALARVMVQTEGVEASTAQRKESTVTEPKIKTCPRCGATGAIGGLFYESAPTYCKPCTTKKVNDHIHKVNELTRSTAENHRQPWSELEVETMLGAVAEGMHAKDIAEMLGRTYMGVHAKLAAVRKLIDQGRAVEYVTFEAPAPDGTATARQLNICPQCNLVRPCFCD